MMDNIQRLLYQIALRKEQVKKLEQDLRQAQEKLARLEEACRVLPALKT